MKWSNTLEPITYSADAIDRDLNRVCNCIAKHEPIFYPYFEVMYDLGVRAVESFDMSRWRVDVSGAVVLQPQKGNDVRIFDKNLLSSTFLSYIKGEINIPDYINYDRLNSAFRRYTMYYNMYVGNKKSSLHLFRHNFVKQQMLLGYSDEEIQQILGERNIKSAQAYINSVYRNKQFKEF